jgi:hypothetical protein
MAQKLFTHTREPVQPLRVERLRVVRRKRRLIVLSIVGAVCLVLGAVGLWASHSDRFAVRSVIISGAQHVSEDAVRSLADTVVHDGRMHIAGRNNIALYPAEDVAQAIEQTFPRVQSATVRVSSWRDRTITISIVERSAYVLWCTDTTNTMCYVTDDAGVVFEPLVYTDQYRVMYGTIQPDERHGAEAPLWGMLEPAYFDSLKKLITECEAFSFDVRTATIDGHDVVLALKNGFDVHADLTASPNDTINALVSVLAQKDLASIPQTDIDYVDVRFGERVFYKLKSQE